jgi:hypothetical protein
MADLKSLDILNLLFGLTTVAAFIFGLVQHYKSKAKLGTLVERLRASRSKLLQLKDQIDHLILTTESEDEPEELLRRVKDSAEIIGKTLHHDVGVIDGGEDWGNMKPGDILDSLN